ncbi:E3 ubiquitin protein ligase DRIP2-like isoform X1 [Chenopodium quinoa]|uniref:RING-type domain-containing protein n=1 Tax=Chenopodium quinoa TaxID=63459 RepID=A0A803KPP0_CHEQI|nr:E3 ubiquitin protein ligase DRIP2-like isoform X1 [Chenopodium quinoa]
MASQLVVQVRRDKLEACMTCPLCKQLLREATTISLCLHTFCRKCIYDKLSDEDVDCCPVCDVNLGIVPEEKLRPDHNLQDIIAKIFPANGRKVEEPEVAPPVSPPAKRKERSLSSLVVSTPRVSMQAGVTGRRTRAGVRKGSAPRGASPATEETPKKEEDSMEDCVDGSSSPETLNKIIQNKKQSSSAKSSNDQNRGEHLENSNEGREGKVDLWKPLNTLVEAANRSKFSKSNLQGSSHVKTDSSCSGDADISMNKTRNEENEQRDEGQDEKNAVPTVPGPAKRKRLRPSNRNRSSAPAEQSSPQVVVNEVRRNWKDGPIWFTLVASEDQEGGEPLPQIPAAFLRVKDGNMPISSIQKYIVKKLDLASEAEVQILLQGQPVQPDLLLSSLLEAWLHASPTQNKIQTVVGDSAKEFVMVISYARKVEAPTA